MKTLLCSLAAILLAGLSMSAQPQSYPSKPIRLLMPSPPGSTFDTIGRIASACLEHEEVVFAVVGDHGNAEEMTAGDGSPRTSHSLAPVPLLLAGRAVAGGTLDDGALRDVAPTLCALLRTAPDAAMTGRNLFRPVGEAREP